MNFNWQHWRAGLLIVVIVLCAMMMIPASGVREIHDTDQISNFAIVDARPGPTDWPWWRGSESRSVAASERIPLDWSATGSEGWQISIPGGGRSTPCLWGDQLFDLTSDDNGQRIFLQSFNRSTGQAIWHAELHHGVLSLLDEADSGLCSSPACDGQYIYCAAAVRGMLWITSVDLKGRIVWQRPAGPYISHHPYQSSPSLFKSLIIVVADQPTGGYIAAVHRQTGEIIWRIRRPKSDSTASPVVATIAGRPQLVLPGGNGVTSYDPATGNTIWSIRWPGARGMSTVAFDDDHVFATSQRPASQVVCIRADGTGDVTDSRVVWRQSDVGCGDPSPVCHAGLLHILADDGRLTCLDAGTGKVEWRKRLEGDFASTPVIAGVFLVCTGRTGSHTILRADSSGTFVAQNRLSDGSTASPIVVGNSIFLRTHRSLHCISASDAQPVVEKPNPLKRRI